MNKSEKILQGLDLCTRREADCEKCPYNGGTTNLDCVEMLLKDVKTLCQDMVHVTRCKDCKHCTLLDDGVSWSCKAWGMDFYSTAYDAATYYCAEAEPKEG